MLARQSNNPVVAVWRHRIAGLPRGTHYDECRAERGQGDIFYSHVGRAVLLSLPHPRHAGAAAHAGAEDAMIPSDVRNGIPYRRLGRTGERVSLVGVGGYHLGRQADEQETIRIVRAAVDNGINFLDNCWDYNGGASGACTRAPSSAPPISTGGPRFPSGSCPLAAG